VSRSHTSGGGIHESTGSHKLSSSHCVAPTEEKGAEGAGKKRKGAGLTGAQGIQGLRLGETER